MAHGSANSVYLDICYVPRTRLYHSYDGQRSLLLAKRVPIDEERPLAVRETMLKPSVFEHPNSFEDPLASDAFKD